jgi:biopolymer transport protein ExbD
MLPKASANLQQMSKQTINLSISADLHYYLNDKPIGLNQIKPAIQQMIANTADATIILRADRSIQLQNLVTILDIGHQLRVKMILATEKE